MKRCFRLTRSTDVKRVRRSGKSYAHPLVVLYVLKSEQSSVRVGVSAGLAVGNAVKRNRAKRLLRAAMNELLPLTAPGSDLLLIARSPLPKSDILHTRAALSILLERAGLLSQIHDA
ncbi:MAG: ribonuclease P protein component [Anaerolineales bacterium]